MDVVTALRRELEVGRSSNNLSEWGPRGLRRALQEEETDFVRETGHPRQESGFFLRALPHCGKPPRFHLPW